MNTIINKRSTQLVHCNLKLPSVHKTDLVHVYVSCGYILISSGQSLVRMATSTPLPKVFHLLRAEKDTAHIALRVPKYVTWIIRIQVLC